VQSVPIRVLIAEDSLVCRELLVSLLQSADGLQVVGAARDGAEAVRLVRRLRPDVVAMDVFMPEVDGLEATRRIMGEMPCPIVMVSSRLSNNEQGLTFDALQAGALSILRKPTTEDPPEVHEALISEIRLMSEVKVVRRWNRSAKGAGKPRRWEKPLIVNQNGKSKIQLVAVAASTGGPGALATILGRLPADFPVPILVVQHVTTGFGGGLVKWLDEQTSLKVRLGRSASEPKAGEVLVAPDNYHMGVNHMGLISLSRSHAKDSICPSANYLFHSVAQVYGATAIGVILTGMGSDGADGLHAMHELGAHTVAQNEETSVVFGMPAVAIESGAVTRIEPLGKIADVLTALV
jgi:two-component system chemotaxis response regulator CheB